MESDKILIPKGWTYFAHRSNTERWSDDPFKKVSLVTNKIMSVITERDIYYDIKHYGKKKSAGYSTGLGKPFEIRCLICSLDYVRSMPDYYDVKDIMLNQFYFDKNNFGGARGARHHSIPKDEELVVIGLGNYDEQYDCESNIIWVIPRRLLNFYKYELKKNNNREISLSLPNNLKKGL